jgi:D-alanyl-D-alanine dipeptidase
MHRDNSFGQLYRPEAKISAHKDTLVIILLASKILNEEYGYKLKINNSLRTVEGQEGMAKYLKLHSVGGFNNLIDLNISDELVSTPGAGSHPRGMAIDVEMLDSEGNLVDCGTPFDSFIYDAETNR